MLRAILLSACVAVAMAGNVCPEIKRADIVVVVDESGSVKQEGWDHQVQFLTKVFSKLPVSPKEVRVGVVQFSTEAKKIFDLNKYTKKKDLIEALKELKYKQKGVTYTDKALAEARGMFKKELGHRKGVQKVVIVLTDGASNLPNETIDQAKKLHKQKVKVLVVGVGNTRKEELNEMASEKKFVLHTADTKSLLKEEFIQEKVLDTLKCITKCAKVEKADVVLMLDQSQSILEDGFIKEKNFTNTIVDQMNIGPPRVHVGLITFADKARAIIKLKSPKSKSKAAIKKIVSKLDWKWGVTNTHLGLKLVEEYFDEKKGGVRPKVPRVLVILSDGRSTNLKETKKAIAKIKSDKRNAVVVIGVGDQVDKKELEYLASNPRYVVRAKTFEDLAKLSFIKKEVIQSIECVVLPPE